jgi:hypothetical protein
VRIQALFTSHRVELCRVRTIGGIVEGVCASVNCVDVCVRVVPYGYCGRVNTAGSMDGVDGVGGLHGMYACCGRRVWRG